MNCSIKASFKKRLDISKTFVLIVGDKTKDLRSGSCQYCSNYNSFSKTCSNNRSVDYRSYIEYECDIAVAEIPKIIMLYNAAAVNKNKCLDMLKEMGTHAKMQYIEDSKRYWDYQSVKIALGQ